MLKFYLLRLTQSTWPEIFYRTRQHYMFFNIKDRLRQGRTIIEIPENIPDNLKMFSIPSIKINLGLADIERILEGQKFFLNTEPSDIQHIEHKYRRRFSKDIFPNDPSFDIRTVWEPSRLQHISILLMWLYMNERGIPAETISESVQDNILTWINENPFLYGTNYMCAMECALRIPIFFYVLKCLEILDIEGKSRILKAMYQHAWWVSKNLSLYSSLGNHTICECIGLIFAGVVFREDVKGSKWLREGIRLLRQEVTHQILDDGGPAEQSLNYHRFVLDLYWMVVGLLEKNGLYDCRVWKRRLMMGETFMAAVTYEQGNFPAIGDSDDGHAIAPGLMPERPTVVVDDKTYQVFPAAGYTIIRGGSKTRLIFDHGPLGMAPFYNHGHADALSIILYKAETPLLIDPGTYRYNGVPQWRRYFKSTRAHNTVTIDGLDQAVQETGFIWSRPYSVDGYAVHETATGVDVQARHNGYSRIHHPVWHKRTISVGHNRYTIVDTFAGSGIHDYELNFHLYPDAVVSSNGSECEIDNSHVTCTIALKDGSYFRHFKGQTDPILGWFSPAYGVKRETTVLSCRKRGRPEGVSFLTEIAV